MNQKKEASEDHSGQSFDLERSAEKTRVRYFFFSFLRIWMI